MTGKRTFVALIAAGALLTGARAGAVAATAPPLVLTLDAREVARNVLHAQLDVPLSGSTLTMVFPKWVPGEHAPANPVVDLVMLAATADGIPVRWERDPVDLFAFTFTVPAHAATLQLRYDALLAPGKTTPRLALIDWNPAVLYPRGDTVADRPISASLLLPAGWTATTALDQPRRSGARIDFGTVSIERLFDSPVLAGANLATFALTPGAELDVASDAPAAPAVDDAVKARFVALVNEAHILFGAHHWRPPYRFLITATDSIGYTGLEHHESSWNGVDGDTLASVAAAKKYAGDLLCHEFVHSWNGKYRRPAGLVRPDFQADETTELLWVYEGLTEYYSNVLAARAGFWTPADYRAALAAKYAYLDVQAGRATRTLADTTFQARLRAGRSAFSGARRAGEEYYDEGELLWLDADTLIRARSHGRRSLDDFAREFFGGVESPPKVVPYGRADVVTALNAIVPYDWDGFFTTRLDVPTAHPPGAGIERGGYRVAFAPKPQTGNPSPRIGAGTGDWRFDIGLRIGTAGAVTDVVAASPAAQAGFAPGMMLVGVADRRFSDAALAAAVDNAAITHAPIALLVNDHDTFKSLVIHYANGRRLPYLAPVATGHASLDDITRPRAGRTR